MTRLRSGMTLSKYAELHDAQNGLCAACGLRETHTYGRHPERQQLLRLHPVYDLDRTPRALVCLSCSRSITAEGALRLAAAVVGIRRQPRTPEERVAAKRALRLAFGSIGLDLDELFARALDTAPAPSVPLDLGQQVVVQSGPKIG